MRPPPPDSTAPDGPKSAREQAAAWVWRLDRGLSPSEQDAFFEWMTADPAHAAALQHYRQLWKRLDPLADWRPEHGSRPNADLLAPHQRRRWPGFFLPFSLAAAACLAAVFFFSSRNEQDAVEPGLPRHENRQYLADGSAAKLNGRSRITVLYTDGERRVRLDEGEAFFIVEKDPARPFVVEAAGVDVRALGTSFNVQLARESVEVLVAEGVVEVVREPASRQADVSGPDPLVLRAHQLLSVPLKQEADPGRVDLLDRRSIMKSLAWQHGLMTFHEEPLSEIVEELNRLNETQLVLLDDTMASTRFSGTIRSDNVVGFARLLSSGFGAQIERSTASEVQLRTRRGAP